MASILEGLIANARRDIEHGSSCIKKIVNKFSDFFSIHHIIVMEFPHPHPAKNSSSNTRRNPPQSKKERQNQHEKHQRSRCHLLLPTQTRKTTAALRNP